MKWSYVISAVAVVMIVWLTLSFFDKTKIRNLDSTGTTIVAFGDSLVSGVGATAGNDIFTGLSKKIGRPIINLGVSGNTTSDALDRIDSVLEKDPRIVIVLIGGNDYLRRIPIDQTFANLETIVEKIQGSGAAVLLLGVRGGLLRDTYDNRFADLAREYRTGFVPNILDGLIGKDEFMSDTVHPNDAGYRKIVDKIYPVLEKMLR